MSTLAPETWVPLTLSSLIWAGLTPEFSLPHLRHIPGQAFVLAVTGQDTGTIDPMLAELRNPDGVGGPTGGVVEPQTEWGTHRLSSDLSSAHHPWLRLSFPVIVILAVPTFSPDSLWSLSQRPRLRAKEAPRRGQETHTELKIQFTRRLLLPRRPLGACWRGWQGHRVCLDQSTGVAQGTSLLPSYSLPPPPNLSPG